ncbi:MAG: Rpn family recombination-promoting nuclease/putative transposase [Treponema sp.]|nr:Rpn family recombination-promoting nuclease/putative transposase [Treponema sp.]
MSFINRKYKDSVFTDLFGSDRDGKKNFLELYNALSGSDYKLEEVTLERKIIEQSLYKTFNNDVSWEIEGKLIVLVEHQSTLNENMPFRCLEYVTRIYEGIVPLNKRYSEKVYKIPNPDFYVVYVGKKEQPLEQELRLSDAFYKKDGTSLELVVKIKNCTNPEILPVKKNCDILKEYCRFIEIVEHYYNKAFPKRSFKKAIEQAVSEGVLADYLDRKSREVINMLCAKYDYKMDIAVKQEEAFQDGKEAGFTEGSQQKAIDDAVTLVTKYHATPEVAANDMHAPLELVLEKLKNQPSVNL